MLLIILLIFLLTLGICTYYILKHFNCYSATFVCGFINIILILFLVVGLGIIVINSCTINKQYKIFEDDKILIDYKLERIEKYSLSEKKELYRDINAFNRRIVLQKNMSNSYWLNWFSNAKVVKDFSPINIDIDIIKQ